jgi:hypothetical protein
MRREFEIGLILGMVACSNKDGATRATASPSAATPTDPNRPLPSPLPEVAATVNGQPIQSVTVAVAALGLLAKGEFDDDHKPEAMRTALAGLIEREILFQEALKRGIKADDRAVDAAYNEARVKYRDDAAWAAHLKGHGTDAVTFRNELRIQKTVSALVIDEAGKIDEGVGDEEARRYLQDHAEDFGGAGFDAAKERVQQAVRQSRRQAAVDRMIAGLKAAARVETFL